jgi:hypothetical protein
MATSAAIPERDIQDWTNAVTKLDSKTLAKWATLFCSVVLIAILSHKMAPRVEPWTFVAEVPQTPIRGDLELRSEVITPPHEPDFVHGASVVATPTGLLALWYRAVYEGAGNAELVSSSFDGSRWSPTNVVTNSGRVSRDIGLTIKSLANPVPYGLSGGSRSEVLGPLRNQTRTLSKGTQTHSLIELRTRSVLDDRHFSWHVELH